VSNPTGPDGTQFCAGSTQLGVFGDAAHAFPASPVALAGCGAARDLQADGSLGAYNPGWDNPTGMTVTTAHWVGFTAASGPSSDYRPTPGLYYFSQSFTLPTGATAPSLTLQVLADNVGAVYLNGTLLGSQNFTDCNNIQGQPLVMNCNWQTVSPGVLPGGMLTVTAASGLFHAAGVANTLEFVVYDVPTGFPVTSGPVGGASPQFGCTTRTPQTTGSHGFSGDNAVTTAVGHVGPLPTGNAMAPTPTVNTPNPTQDGCENPSGLAFAGTVSFTPPPAGIWCSPGFWKNHGIDLWVPLQGLAYNTHGPYPNDPQTFVGFDFGKKVGLQNPTLLQVIQNPSIYGGPATNNVASYISNQLFGTPLSANPTENCPDPLPLT